MSRRMLWMVVCLGAAMILMGLLSCGKPSPPMEKPIPLATPQAEKPPEPMPKLPPPTTAEVESAVHRIFGDDLVLEHGSGQSFIVGDFNGVRFEDVAGITRSLQAKLEEIDMRLANSTI